MNHHDSLKNLELLQEKKILRHHIRDTSYQVYKSREEKKCFFHLSTGNSILKNKMRFQGPCFYGGHNQTK